MWRGVGDGSPLHVNGGWGGAAASPQYTGGGRVGGGNQNVEGDLLTFGYLMLDDSLPSHYRLFNVGWYFPSPYNRLINVRWYLPFTYYRLINVLWLPFLKIKKVRVPSLKIKKFRFISCSCFFDRYEIHIQALVLFSNGKLIIFNPHLRKTISNKHIHFFTKNRKMK